VEPHAHRLELGHGLRELSAGAKAALLRALEALKVYSWPGNVRELRNVIHRAVVMGPGGVIGLDDLPERLGEEVAQAPADAAGSAAATPHAGAVGDSGVRLDYKTRIQNYEIKVITEALAAEGGNKTAAAVRLGLPLRTLSYKMKTLGIEGAK
jgi:DNA-binding NtrC family response regulator